MPRVLTGPTGNVHRAAGAAFSNFSSRLLPRSGRRGACDAPKKCRPESAGQRTTRHTRPVAIFRHRAVTRRYFTPLDRSPTACMGRQALDPNGYGAPLAFTPSFAPPFTGELSAKLTEGGAKSSPLRLSLRESHFPRKRGKKRKRITLDHVPHVQDARHASRTSRARDGEIMTRVLGVWDRFFCFTRAVQNSMATSFSFFAAFHLVGRNTQTRTAG